MVEKFEEEYENLRKNAKKVQRNAEKCKNGEKFLSLDDLEDYSIWASKWVQILCDEIIELHYELLENKT